MKFKLFSLLSLLLWTTSIMAQKNISGTVTATDGETLIGVNIIEKGTSNGTISDIDGTFQLTVQDGATLEISYTGYATTAIVVGEKTNLSIVLSEGVALDEIVVTALGISREKKSLTYASQEVSGEALTDVKDANLINSLAGKAAGVFINRSGGGVGGSSRVVLRGNSSLTNNEPLYVVDGIPLTNNRGGSPDNLFGKDNAGASIDSGDGISNINPEDIESMTVLKGASAAALYGSQAANGVILITTKKGKEGKAKINFSSSLLTETAAFIPELQYEYGQTSEGAEFSWGDKVNAPNHVDDFFQTGTNWINALSISGGTENFQSYFSYSNTSANGIIETNKLSRHNFNFTQTANFFDNRLELKSATNVVNQTVENRPAGGLYFNPLTGLYFFPRGLDFNTYKTNFETFDPARNFNTQNWIADRDIQQNPYWVLNRNLNTTTRNRLISSLTAAVKITDWMKLQLRGNMDKSIDDYNQKVYASTQATLSDSNGRYTQQNSDDTQTYADAILSINHHLNDDLSLGVNLGASHTKRETAADFFDSKNANLRFANIFSLQNIQQANSSIRQSLNRTKLNAVFASASLGLKNTWYLDATLRNDWSSSLPTQDFPYYSVGLSAVLSEVMNADAIDFLKLRASYATVGNGVDAYVANARTENHQISSATGLTVNREGPIPGTLLVPEESKSFEVGLDLRVLDNKLTFDVTYYNTNTTNQFIKISAPAGSGFSKYLVNAGDIQNSGIEGFLGIKAIDTPDFTWDFGLNFTANTNEIIELSDALGDTPFFINDPEVNSYAMVVRKGGSFGDIYGRKFLRDASGNIVVTDGKPQPTEGALELLGNPNPDFMAGLTSSLNFKGIVFKFLIDGRFGGEVMSITEALLDEFGVSQRTADARNAGGVDVGGATIDAEAYYTGIGGRSGITEAYVYDATNIRLRELSIGFAIPKAITKNLGFIESARLSLVGRNLFFFKNEAPFDPDVTFSTGVGFQGVDVFSLPSTRSFGFNLSLGF